MLRISILVAIGLCVAESFAQENGATPVDSAKAPVDQLIPWLLDEDRQLRGIPFSEVIADVTGKKMLPFDPKSEVDQRVVRGITAACDETLKRLNAPDSLIQKIDRINEVSSHF